MSRCLAEMSSQPLKRAAQPEDGERQPAKKARDEEQSAELSNDVSEQQTGGDGGNRTHQAAAASGSSSGSDSVGVSDSKGYVGWLNTVTEIVGHKYPCITRGKYRYHSGKGSELPGYYCCLDAKQSAGTTLSMQRNRHNHYDMNAIEVHGSGGCMLGHLPKYLAAELAPLLDCGKVWLQGDGFDVGRGSPGDFFTLLVHADEAWFAGRPKGDRLTAGWAALRRRLTVDQPPQGEEEGGCFRFPRE